MSTTADVRAGYRTGRNRTTAGNRMTSAVTAITEVTDDPRGTEMDAPIPTVVPPRHLYRIPEAMRLLSMSRSVIYELIRAKRLRTVTVGRSRLVPAAAITEFVEMLLQESEVEL